MLEDDELDLFAFSPESTFMLEEHVQLNGEGLVGKTGKRKRNVEAQKKHRDKKKKEVEEAHNKLQSLEEEIANLRRELSTKNNMLIKMQDDLKKMEEKVIWTRGAEGIVTFLDKRKSMKNQFAALMSEHDPGTKKSSFFQKKALMIEDQHAVLEKALDTAMDLVKALPHEKDKGGPSTDVPKSPEEVMKFRKELEMALKLRDPQKEAFLKSCKDICDGNLNVMSTIEKGMMDSLKTCVSYSKHRVLVATRWLVALEAYLDEGQLLAFGRIMVEKPEFLFPDAVGHVLYCCGMRDDKDRQPHA